MKNKEKFLLLVSEENDEKTITELKQRIKNRAMLRESQQIAIKVLMKLDQLKWSQKDLANAMEVSPQQISKIVSGKENLTIETQVKLQNVLDIPILASYYEKKVKEMNQLVAIIEKKEEKLVAQSSQIDNNYQSSKAIIKKLNYSQEYYQAIA
jgi:transcriptional regulator with XRE-family HTH domain